MPYAVSVRKPKKNPWAQDAARKRALKLGPERCREIATLASRAAAKARSEKAAERRRAQLAEIMEPEMVEA